MAVDLVVWVSRLEKRPWSLSIPRSGEALACEWEDEGNHMLRVCDCNNNQSLKVFNLTPKYIMSYHIINTGNYLCSDYY